MTNKEAIAVFKGFKFLPREQKAVDLAIKALEERPQGEWVVDNYGMYHCNYCMKEKQQLFHNFCSNCGADMRGKEE